MEDTLYQQKGGGTHVRFSIYLQEVEHSCMILYICNRRSTHVRSTISATREVVMLDPLYLQQGGTHVRSSASSTRGELM